MKPGDMVRVRIRGNEFLRIVSSNQSRESAYAWDYFKRNVPFEFDAMVTEVIGFGGDYLHLLNEFGEIIGVWTSWVMPYPNALNSYAYFKTNYEHQGMSKIR